jgi:hypothetical protein
MTWSLITMPRRQGGGFHCGIHSRCWRVRRVPQAISLTRTNTLRGGWRVIADEVHRLQPHRHAFLIETGRPRHRRWRRALQRLSTRGGCHDG